MVSFFQVYKVFTMVNITLPDKDRIYLNFSEFLHRWPGPAAEEIDVVVVATGRDGGVGVGARRPQRHVGVERRQRQRPGTLPVRRRRFRPGRRRRRRRRRLEGVAGVADVADVARTAGRAQIRYRRRFYASNH